MVQPGWLPVTDETCGQSSSRKKSLKRDAVWTAIDVLVTSGLLFLFRLLVARVLAPEEFGTLALALAVYAIIQVINDFGLTAAIIQRPEEKFDEGVVNTVFSASVTFSLLIFLLNTFVLAPAAAWFFQNQMVGVFVAVVGVTYLLTPFVSVLRALMFRERRYKTVTVVRSASMLVSLAVGGAYLLVERDGWGLVLQIVLGQFLLAAGLWWTSTWRLRLRFDRAQFRELFGYSGLVFSNDVAVSITKNFDVMLVGRVLSEAQVGLYSLAFYITDIARMNLMAVLNRVMFTQYSSIQQDHALVRRYYAITLRWNCLVLFPMMLALILFGPSMATQFLGAEWEHMTFPLRALAVAVIIHAAGGTTSTLFRSLGKPGLDLTLYLLTSVAFLIPLLFVGVYWWGIDGAAAAVALNRLIAVLLRQYWLNRLLPQVTVTVLRVVAVAIIWQLPLIALGLGAQLIWADGGWVRDAVVAAILLGGYFIVLGHRARTERA